MQYLLKKIWPFVCLALLVGCGDYEQKICGEYRLTRCNATEVRISRPNGYQTMINGNIENYAVRDPYITGYANTNNLDVSSEPRAKEGYFLLNTSNDNRLEAMTESEWKVELQKINWPSPKLNPPR